MEYSTDKVLVEPVPDRVVKLTQSISVSIISPSLLYYTRLPVIIIIIENKTM